MLPSSSGLLPLISLSLLSDGEKDKSTDVPIFRVSTSQKARQRVCHRHGSDFTNCNTTEAYKIQQQKIV
jgi:hypothetical protein